MQPNSLTIARPNDAAPAPLPGRVAGRLDDMAAAVKHEGGRDVILARHAPDAAQRQWLALRRDAIDAAMHPIGRDGASAQWARLTTALRPRQFGGEAEARLAASEAVTALAGLPRFAVESAVSEFIRGVDWAKDFAPEIPTVARRASDKAAALAAERARIARVLAAEVIAPPDVSPERQAEIVAKMRGVAEAIRAQAAARDVAAGIASPAPRPETPEEALARLASAPPVGLSADALARLRG